MTSPFFHFRALAVAAFAALALAGWAQPAAADDTAQAQAYVQQNIQKGMAILSNQSLSQAQKQAQFRTFLNSLTDAKRIATFTLGNARRAATPQEIQAFDTAFQDYATAIYESRLSKFSGQTLQVTGATARAPGDYVVTTTLVDPSDDNSKRSPLEVDFRVLTDNGHFVVIDVAVAGVWLALEERDQFAAFLNDHGGNISALVSHLQDLTAKLRSGGQDQNQQE